MKVIDDRTSEMWLELYEILNETLSRYWKYSFSIFPVLEKSGDALPQSIRVRLGKKIKVVKPHYRTEVTYNFWGKRMETSVPDGTSSVEEVACIAIFEISLGDTIVNVLVNPKAGSEQGAKDRKEIMALLTLIQKQFKKQRLWRTLDFELYESDVPSRTGMVPTNSQRCPNPGLKLMPPIEANL